MRSSKKINTIVLTFFSVSHPLYRQVRSPATMVEVYSIMLRMIIEQLLPLMVYEQDLLIQLKIMYFEIYMNINLMNLILMIVLI
jgi:hypothetical protein